ncbi:MAG: sulfatase [Bacteroidota bacterium]
MNRIKPAFTAPIILCLAFFFTASCSQTEKDPLSGSKPNIIFILADDLGWADLPSYGNPFNEAPNLMRMAEEGIRFTDAYAACPVCSPTRASIMSGQYPARVGIIDFITGHWRPYEQVTVPTNRSQYLPLEVYTMGEAMKDAGYATAYFGKWHLGGGEYYPQHQGFDRVNVYQGGGFFDYAGRMSTPVEAEPGKVLSQALTDLSIEFIENHSEVPFFLFLAHFDVHVQLDADSSLIRKYLEKEKVEGYPCNAVYAAMVEQVDNSVGRILQKVQDLGLAENTLVVFFSDNGGLISRFDKVPLLADSKQYLYKGDTLLYVASSNAPLRAEKGTLYEGGIREPMLMWWPGSLGRGEVNDALVSSVDFLPTFAELAGIRLPEKQVFDGISLVKVMEGELPDPEREIYWHYPVYHHSVPASAIRKGKWKLVHNLVDDSRELFNLENDMGETTNLADQYPEVTAGLSHMLEIWRTDCQAALPVPNPGFDPARRYEWGKHPDQH